MLKFVSFVMFMVAVQASNMYGQDYQKSQDSSYTVTEAPVYPSKIQEQAYAGQAESYNKMEENAYQTAEHSTYMKPSENAYQQAETPAYKEMYETSYQTVEKPSYNKMPQYDYQPSEKAYEQKTYASMSNSQCDSSIDFTSVPGSCTKFRRCSNGHLYILRCPYSTVWDNHVKTCVRPEQAPAPCGTKMYASSTYQKEAYPAPSAYSAPSAYPTNQNEAYPAPSAYSAPSAYPTNQKETYPTQNTYEQANSYGTYEAPAAAPVK
ncbi:hypothetical protein BpHYR1_050030, partial [Brachionus plicatilis]